jgi:N-acetylglucosaminyl-diphospho-decaprenol L-rhamnosyltransferase
MPRDQQAERSVKYSSTHHDGHDGLSVVIVTYQNAAEIEQCLSAVCQATPDIPTELIIVDNASVDDTVAVARGTDPAAKIINQSHNGGFADGCIAGANAAVGRWLLFLNPDAIIAPDAIKALLRCATDHPSAGIVGGRFVDEDGNTDPSSWWGRPSLWSAVCFALGLNTFFARHPFFNPEAPRPWTANPNEVRFVPIVSGAFMLVKRELWHELAGFDLAFFMYGEDADFCLRAAKIGCRPIVTARAICHHAGGKSSSSVQKLIFLYTGKSTLIRRHFPRGLRSVGIFLLLTGVFIRAMAGNWRGITVRKDIAVRPDATRPRTRLEDWRVLWDNRKEWQKGWTNLDH